MTKPMTKITYQEDVSLRIECLNGEAGKEMRAAVEQKFPDPEYRVRLRHRKTDGGFHVAIKVRREQVVA
jgi:hypothetical protein